jgi:hypothetical protein
MACSNTGGSATALIAIVSGDSMAAIDPVVIVIDPAPGETRYLLSAGNKATPIVRLIVRFLRFSETANYLTYCFNWRPQGDSNLPAGIMESVAYSDEWPQTDPRFPLIPLNWPRNWPQGERQVLPTSIDSDDCSQQLRHPAHHGRLGSRLQVSDVDVQAARIIADHWPRALVPSTLRAALIRRRGATRKTESSIAVASQ